MIKHSFKYSLFVIILLMNAEYIAQKARKAIGDFCFEECGAYCCRKGYLILQPKELLTVVNTPSNLQHEIKKLENGTYSLNLGCNGCPSLKDFKCLIHKKRLRPKVCKEFPIFVGKKCVKLSSRCLAVRQGKLYPFIKEWKKMGVKIIEGDDFDVLP